MYKAAKLEVVEEAHELCKINVRDSFVTSDHQHVFIVLACRCVAEICGASDQQGVLSQWINDHVFRMNIFDVGVQPAEVLFHPSFELVLRQDVGDRQLVEERRVQAIHVFICAFQQNVTKIRFWMLEYVFKKVVNTKRCGEKDCSVGLIH